MGLFRQFFVTPSKDLLVATIQSRYVLSLNLLLLTLGLSSFHIAKENKANALTTEAKSSTALSPSLSCTPVDIAYWSMEYCESYVNDPTTFDYSEFTATYPSLGGCTGVSASNIYRNEGTQSCTDGALGADPIGMCVDVTGVNNWSTNDNKAIRFEITLNPSDVGRLTGLNFYEKAPSIIQIFNGNQRDNNYPAKYGIRVSKNGTQIFQQINISTTQDWTLESFDFSNNPQFSIYTTTTFEFELLAYEAVNNNGIVTVWDVDNFTIQGSCGACPEICDNNIDDDGDGLFDENDADCCDNVTDGGQISGDQILCGVNPDPSSINELTSPNGGSGDLVYMWLASTTGCPDNFNQVIGGATSASYNPGPLSETTWFVRCVRRAGCTNASFFESNCVKIEVAGSCGGSAPSNWEYNCGDGVAVEIIGEGIQCNDNQTINILNPGNVTQIIAEVVYKGHSVDPGFYTFNTDVESVTIEGQKTNPGGGYFYRTVLQPASFVSIDIPSANNCKAQTMLLYVFRNDANAGGSSGEFVESWMYHSTICKTLTIPAAPTTRDLEIIVPLSELTNDGRIVNITATAGGQSNTITINSSNLGNSLNITPFILANVPAGTNSVEICVESPTGSPNGQSLVFSGAIKVESFCLPCENSDLAGTALILSDFNGEAISCNGANDAQATIELTGGFAPFSYEWSNGENTATVNDLAPGNYSVTVTDQIACEIVEEVTITEPSILTCSANVTSNYNEGVQISTLGGNDGSAIAQANGGTGAYTFQWNDAAAQNNSTATNLSAGTYEVLVSDANGCTCTTTVNLQNPAKIGNLIFEDKNGNGLQDAGELGIPNIGLTLTGTTTNGTPVTRTLTTGPDGTYQFDGLPEGSYKITLTDLADYQITYPNEVGTEATDSDVDPTNNMSNTVTVGIGEYYPNLDAGLYLPAKLGNYAWADINANGLQDSEESGFSNITITLTGTTGNGTPVSREIATGDEGEYQFDNLIPGSYQLVFSIPNGFNVSSQDEASDNGMDSDIDPITGMTSIEVLESNEDNDSYDAGFYQTSSIGNFVWEDLNGNGIQDAGEPGIGNVTVILDGTAGDGTIINQSTTTDENGFYIFPNLKPGIYQLTFETLEGYFPSYSFEGTNPALDSDANPSTGQTVFETLVSGENNETYDAAFYRPASIGNTVWDDLNGNGIQEDNEPGIGNVAIQLTGFTGNGTPISLSLLSKPSGDYSFLNLAPGTYQLTFVQPDGYEVTYQNLGSGTTDSDIDPTTGLTIEETLVSGEDNDSYDAGYYQPVALGNFVWEDINGNGLQDENEPGLGNVQITLTGTDGAGFAVNEVIVTQTNGNYFFPNLRPGSYQVTIGTLPNYNFTAQNEGDDTKDSDVDVSTGTTVIEILTSGQTNTDLDAGLFAVGSIGDYAWIDCDRNGIQSDDEEGLALVPVNLSGTTGNGTPINLSTTTDEVGFYQFENLKPGNYILTFGFPSSPIGLDYSSQGQGGDQTLDSDVNASGQTESIAVGSGEENPNIDAGFIDATAPVINPTAEDDLVECDGSGNILEFNAWLDSRGGANATDNYAATVNIIWTNDFDALSNDCGATGTVTVTFTATDECGNSSNTTASFTIEDTTDPNLIGVPTDVTVSCDAIPVVATPTATDNCSSSIEPVFNEVETAGDCPNSFVLTRTWTATDDCGNETIQTQVITVEDNTVPSLLGVLADLQVSCDEVPAPAQPLTSDNCDTNVSVDFSENRIDGDCTYNYTLIRTWTATDACGNETSQSQTIEVTDDEDPTLIGVPADLTIDCDEVPAIPQIGSAITATDNCDPNVDIQFNEIQTTGDCPNAYTLTRTWTATDVCGNETIETQIITVEDNTDPVLLGVPTDATVSCDNIPVAANPTATDNCDSNVSIDFNEVQSNAACLNEYTLTRTWTATDACGNETVETQVITVEDNTDPVLIGVPTNLSVSCEAVPAPTNPTATDNCSGTVNIDFNETQTTGDCPNSYTLTRTWTATDVCGNETIETQIITVEDDTDPVLIDVPGPITVECDGVPNPAQPTATDNCDPDVTIVLQEIYSDSTCLNNYTLTRIWTATDDCGNQTIQTQLITVEDTTIPVVSGVPSDVTIECDAIPIPPSIFVSDNCDIDVDLDFSEVQSNTICPNSYTLTRTWTATDACGNENIQTQIITVEDTTDPILIGVPADLVVACDEVPTVAQPTATDNCDSNVSLDFVETNAPGTCANSYIISRTWTATDACGNETVQTQTITVEDQEAPSLLGVPSDETVECDAIPAVAQPTATDNCDTDVNISFSENQTNVICANAYTLVRTWTATDACGNETIETQTIIVEDTTDPILIGVPVDLTVECDAIPAVAQPTATDNCATDVSISFNENTTGQSCANTFNLVRTWTATDACGNETIETQVITVEDNAAPTLISVPADLTVECDAIPAAAQPTATDNCDSDVSIDFNESQINTICANSYTLVRTWTATDACGHATVETQTITVEDTTDPILTGIPADVNAECDNIPAVAQPTATDNCTTDVVIGFNEVQTAGDCANSYILTRTWTATDACGNETIQTQVVNVEDTTDPILIGVPTDEIVECDNIPPPAEPTATDNCDTNVDIAFGEVQTAGDCANGYTLTRTWMATDACGNETIATQIITVEDEEGPILLGVPADASAECQNIPAPAEPTATDNCDADVQIIFSEVQTTGNCSDTYLLVRTWSATDACGNETVATQTISVEDSTPPTLLGVPSDAVASCDAIPAASNPTVTDNCDTNVSIDFNEFIANPTCANSYTLVRTWTATDACGNQTVATQNIIVEDTTNPVLSGVPADTNAECDNVPAAPGAGVLVATDNCDNDVNISFAEVLTPGSCLHEYTITRTWTATDACGNQDQQTQIITVEDTTLPTLIGVPADASAGCGDIPPTPIIGIDILATDNCDANVSILFNEVQTMGNCGESFILTRTWTATDECGNQAIETQVVTIGDDAPPVISGVPADLSVECDNIPAAAQATAIDDCATAVEVVLSEEIVAGDCAGNYQLIRTWTATDNCDNEAMSTQVITVEDTTDPILLGVPSDLTVDCNDIPVAPTDIQATDNCDTNVSVTFNEQSEAGDCDGALEILRTWIATDHCGNTSVATQVISVADEEAPMLSGIPDDVTVECNNIPAVANPQATDDCDDQVDIAFEEIQTPINCTDNYILTRVWTATDNCGKETVATQTITVEDTTDPILLSVPGDITVDLNNGGVIPSPANVLATDNCDTNVDIAFNETETQSGCGLLIIRTWTATDNCGNSVSQSQNITVTDSFTASISPENPEFCAGATIQFEATPMGSDLTYEWSATGGNFNDANSANPTYSMMMPGTYTITLSIEGVDGCSGIATTTVTVTEDGVGTAGVNSNICEGDDILLTASGGLVYFWTGPNNFTSNQQNPVIPNSTIADSGTYTVNIGGGNCSGIVDVEVVVSEGLTGDFNKTNVTCDDLGMINVGIFGGLGIYTYDWSDLPGTDNGEDRTDLEPGIYSVIVTDAGGCTFSINNIQIVDECGCTANAGGLFADTGGLCLDNGPVSLSATPNGNAQVPTGFSVIYVLTSGNDLVIQQVNAAPVFVVNEVGDYTIHTLIYDPVTLNLGIIQFGVTTGVDVNGLLQQGGGSICGALDVMGVSFGVSIAQATVSTLSPEVCDEENGSALLAPSDYSYSWPDGATGASRNDLSAGTYEVLAIDEKGCEDIVTVVIGSICECVPPIVNNTVIVETSCGEAQGSASIVVAGNPMNFSYSWFPNTGTPNTIGNARTDLIAGVYSVTITNTLIEDCFIVEEFAIGNIDGPIPTDISTTAATCTQANGSATLLPSNYNYVWLFDNFPASTRNDLPAGVYEVIVIDPNLPDCPNIATVVIEEENNLSAEVNVTTHPACGDADGVVDINASGGSGNYSYHWNDGTDLITGTRSGLSSGFYMVSIEDEASNCITVLSFVLTDDVVGANIVILPEEVRLDCSGDANGTVDFTVSILPGFVEPALAEIKDVDGNVVINGTLSAGQYCITVQDGNGCLAGEACFMVVEPEAIDVEVALMNQSCTIGGTINLTVEGGNGGYTFDWDDLPGTFNPQNRTNLVEGTYNVTVTDFAGCSAVVNNLAIVDDCNPTGECDTPIVENVLTVESNCGSASGSATIMMVGQETDFAYEWTPNVSSTYFANNLVSGVYTVLVTDITDPTCFTEVSFAIGNADGPNPEIVSTTPATCTQSNGTAVLAPVNYIYEWCNGVTGFNVVNLPAGTCFVTVTNPATGCTNITEVFIETVNTLVVEANITELPECNEATGAVTIDVTGGSTSYNYNWSDGGTGESRDNLAAGIYMVTVTDNGSTGCTSTVTFTLVNDVDAAATVNLASDTVFVSCIGSTDGQIDFDIDLAPGFVEPASTVIIDAEGNTYTNGELPTGNYCIFVYDADDCLTGEDCFVVLAPELLNVDVSLFNKTCDTTGMIQVLVTGGNGGYIFDWADLNGPFNPQNRTGLEVGAYSLTVTDFNGCSVVANDLPIIDECSGCPSIDTVQLGLPINSQGNYCFELESCFDSVGITYALYDGGLLGNSNFGNWTLDVDGCLTYNSNAIPGVGVDTICIVASDNGLLDTTCVVITITTDCALFAMDTIQLETFECDLGGSFCMPIDFMDIGNYTILDNGMPYAGGFTGCETDTTITYFLGGLINDDPIGPYQLISWNVESVTFDLDTFVSLSELVDSMNVWDPVGNWTLLPGNIVESGNILNNYGPLNIRSYATTNSTISGVTININNDGTLITLDTGFHQIIISELSSGCVDTLNIGLECIDCPSIYDGPMVLDAPNCNELLPVCLEMPIEEILNLSVTDNGQPYTAGFIGCDLDSIYTYLAINFTAPGNYVLESWEVDGVTYSTNFGTAAELVDSMNVWDPNANWVLNVASIEGGDFGNTYGSLNVSQNGLNIATSLLTVNLFPNGIAVSLDTGFHQVIVTNTIKGCVDTLNLQINCVECPEEYYTGPTLLTADDCDSLTQLCVGLDAESVFNYVITDNGEFYDNGFIGCDFDSIYTYVALAFSQPGNYVLSSWQVNNVFFSMGNFVSTQELVDSMNVWDPNGNWSIDGTNIEGGDFNQDYGAIVVAQFGLEITNSLPTLNLSPRGLQMALDTGFHEIIIVDSIAGCLDTFEVNILCDDFSPLPTDTILLELLIGFTDTFCLDTTVLPGIIDTIYNICESESGNFVEFGLSEDTYCLEYTAFDLGVDPACIVICDDQDHCDTTVLLVGVVPPMVDTIMQDIIFGEIEAYCIDTTELAGAIDTIYNYCEDLSGENIEFNLDQETFCVTFEGLGLGTDQACIVICDEFGYCDTSILFVTNLMGLGEGPVAVDNDSVAIVNTPVIIDILGNDTINGVFLGVELLDEPTNGVAVLNVDYTFTYVPNRDTCGFVDSFTYVLMTSTGNDTATVFIDVLCDELTIFSGFSPNRDGVNDFFTIRGIEQFPNNTVLVFNRWGNQVYRAEGYTNAQAWDGTWEGDHLPDGTYFYVIDDGEGERYSGYVQIHR